MNQKLARRAQNQSLSGMGESLGQEDISGSGVNQDIIFPAVILSGLDALTTEDSVLNILGSLTKLPMKSVRIGRDPLTNMSRGVCYVEMNSVVGSKFRRIQWLYITEGVRNNTGGTTAVHVCTAVLSSAAPFTLLYF